VNYVDIAVSIIVTSLAAEYMRKVQNNTKPVVIYERRKRRQANPSVASLATLEGGLVAPQPVRLPHVGSTSSLERSSADLLLEAKPYPFARGSSRLSDRSVSPSYPPSHW
jgi:hypothetical protein